MSVYRPITYCVSNGFREYRVMYVIYMIYNGTRNVRVYRTRFLFRTHFARIVFFNDLPTIFRLRSTITLIFADKAKLF